MQRTSLQHAWEFKKHAEPRLYMQLVAPKDIWRPAGVPGHVHLDLVASGVIANPFLKQFEAGCQWVDQAGWEYRTCFEWKPKPGLPKRMLRFAGLDTVCEVLLNGCEVARSDNMYVPLEIDVSDKLCEGENELLVLFQSALAVGEQRRADYFEREGLVADIQNFYERAFVRKAQYMYGWDWGPRLASCGIWQPIELLEYESRIRSFHVFQQRLENGSFAVRTETTVEGSIQPRVRFGDHESVGDLDLEIESPELWWPNGMGEQFLYEASAWIPGQEITKHIGLRTIELVREPDRYGESFRFRVNDKDVWSRGANWIPNDSFPSRTAAEDYRRQIELCKNLNFNMLRVWGGGIYEQEAFYDACDEHGILVWQDFPYSCAYYPDDNSAQEVARVEAEHHVGRLSDRTCLALWCGNNENLMLWDMKFGDPEKQPPRYYGEDIFRKVLPEVVDRLSPHVAYIDTSPFSNWPAEPEAPQANEGGTGDQHYWDVWHGRGDWVHYAESTGRFVSEFGFASSCSGAQWLQVLAEPETHNLTHAEMLAAKNRLDPTVRWHDKTLKPFDAFSRMVALHYPESEELDDWIYYSQLNQRDALRFAIERFRTSGFCDGALIWQLNDCWPVQSWAVQDYARFVKPAGFELQRLYAPELIAVLPEAGGVRVHLLTENEKGLVTLEVVDSKFGRPRPRKNLSVPREGTFFSTASFRPGETAIRVSAPQTGAAPRWHLLSEPKDADFGVPSLDASFDGEALQLHVIGLLYDAVLMDADDPSNAIVADDNLIGSPALTLWNESRSVRFQKRPTTLEIRWLDGKTCITPT